MCCCDFIVFIKVLTKHHPLYLVISRYLSTRASSVNGEGGFLKPSPSPPPSLLGTTIKPGLGTGKYCLLTADVAHYSIGKKLRAEPRENLRGWAHSGHMKEHA